MSSAPLVLIYGTDATLVQTRGWVLELAGCRVEQAGSVADVSALLSSRPIDLLLLCHSLNAEERRGALAIAHQQRPAARRLILCVDGAAGSRPDGDATLTAFIDTETLLSTVRELVRLTPAVSIAG